MNRKTSDAVMKEGALVQFGYPRNFLFILNAIRQAGDSDA
jgi:hypothetical protein